MRPGLARTLTMIPCGSGLGQTRPRQGSSALGLETRNVTGNTPRSGTCASVCRTSCFRRFQRGGRRLGGRRPGPVPSVGPRPHEEQQRLDAVGERDDREQYERPRTAGHRGRRCCRHHGRERRHRCHAADGYSEADGARPRPTMKQVPACDRPGYREDGGNRGDRRERFRLGKREAVAHSERKERERARNPRECANAADQDGQIAAQSTDTTLGRSRRHRLDLPRTTYSGAIPVASSELDGGGQRVAPPAIRIQRGEGGVGLRVPAET